METRGYEVTLVEPWTYLNERNNPVEGYRVSFVTDSGMSSFVYVGKNELGTQAAKDKIALEVSKIEAMFI